MDHIKIIENLEGAGYKFNISSHACQVWHGKNYLYGFVQREKIDNWQESKDRLYQNIAAAIKVAREHRWKN